MNIENKTYFDPGLYNSGNGKEFRDDLVALAIENAAGVSLEGRITPYEISFNENNEPNFKLRWETETDFKENEALFKVRDLMRNGSNHVLWISPPSKEIGYEESRMVVFINKGEEDGNLKVECRGLCSEFGEKKCLDIANSLGGGFKEAEELRSNPIKFEIKKGESWIDVLGGKIDLPQVWEAIKKGDDVNNKREKKEIVNSFIYDFVPRFSNKMSDYEKLVLGAEIEEALKRKGVELQSRGSCGISNSEALKLQGSFDIVFKKSLMSGERPEGYDYYCSICECWCKGKVCPLCKKEIGH